MLTQSITVKAALTFGNVRHTGNQPYNYESGSADDGYFPRDSAMQALLDTYEDVWRDYCVSGDPICAQGDTVADHLSYYPQFVQDQQMSEQADGVEHYERGRR